MRICVSIGTDYFSAIFDCIHLFLVRLCKCILGCSLRCEQNEMLFCEKNVNHMWKAMHLSCKYATEKMLRNTFPHIMVIYVSVMPIDYHINNINIHYCLYRLIFDRLFRIWEFRYNIKRHMLAYSVFLFYFG